jgi:uncharacterized protein (DUF427 family)
MTTTGTDMARLTDLLRRAAPRETRVGRVQVFWKGAVLPDGDRTLVLESNHYFPSDSVDERYLRPSERITVCPWKGVASYHSIEVDGERNEAAAWYYPDPSPAAAEIKDHVAFWRGVRVVRADEA